MCVCMYVCICVRACLQLQAASLLQREPIQLPAPARPELAVCVCVCVRVRALTCVFASVYMSACACVLGVILDYCIYQMHKVRPRDVTPPASRPLSFPPLIHPDTTCWRRMNWGHFQEPGRGWDRSPHKRVSSHAGPANHQL